MIRPLLVLLPIAATAASLADSAIISLMRSTDKKLPNTSVVDRASVSDEFDLVLAVASSHPPSSASTTIWSSEGGILGLFLQRRDNPGIVFKLTSQPGIQDCFARLERATATDALISCAPEKGSIAPSQKFIYDIRAKTLLHHLEYQPFSLIRAFPQEDGVAFIANDGKRVVAFDYKEGRSPTFQMLDGSAAEKWTRRYSPEPKPFKPVEFGPGKTFRLIREGDGMTGSTLVVSEIGKLKTIHYLPQSTYDQFAKMRPQRVQNGYNREGTQLMEEIGPWQIEGDRLWIGKSYYDGEGHTGIGGFGYFDPEKRQYRIFSPPEIRQSSVTAMLVEPDAVWLGLAVNGEWGSRGTGLIRFDRRDETVQKFDSANIINGIVRLGNKVFFTTEFGVEVMKEGQFQRYFVDKLSDGRLRIAEANINQ